MTSSTYKISAAIAAAIALILIGSVIVANAVFERADTRAASETAPLKPIPADFVDRLDTDGAHFTPDEAATATRGDEAARAAAVAVGFLNFLEEDQVAFASLGDATVDESPQLRERTRVWVVVLQDVSVPLFGEPSEGEKSVPEDFYVVVDANKMTAQYGGSFDDDV